MELRKLILLVGFLDVLAHKADKLKNFIEWKGLKYSNENMAAS